MPRHGIRHVGQHRCPRAAPLIDSRQRSRMAGDPASPAVVMHWALSGQTLQAPAGACRNHLRLIEPIRVMRSRCSSQRRSASSNSSSVGGFFFSCVVSDVLSDVG